MHNMSIKCCSAKLPSLLTFRCNAVNTFFRSISARPHSRLIRNNSGLGWPDTFVMTLPARGCVVSLAVEGGMAKYSSSSRKTMMGCLTIKGLPSRE